MKFNRKILYDIPSLLLGMSDHPDDYCHLTSEKDVAVGVCEIVGRRGNQEDRVAYSIDVAAQFVDLPESLVQQALLKTFAELQEKYGQPSMGSTACMTTAWIDSDDHLRVWNSNLGDSAAWLVTFDQVTETASILNLNKLHSPDPAVNPAEHARCTTCYRLGTTLWVVGDPIANLSMTRAIGDNYLEPAGMSHVPELFHHTALIEPNKKYFLMTACDGLTERDVLTPASIASICAASQKQKQPLHELARQLVATAYTKSYDNISVVITEIKDRPVSLAVFDGHGGDNTSIALAKHFYPTLSKTINAIRLESNPTNDALAMALRKKDYSMAVFILTTMPNCAGLPANLLSKINSRRTELTDAVITAVTARKRAADVRAAVDQRDGERAAEECAAVNTQFLAEILYQKNALGIILNTPRYHLFFKFTHNEYNRKKITGSIHKIRDELFMETLAADTAQYTEMQLLGTRL